MLDQTKEWRTRDDFALLSVSLDAPSTLGDARDLVREHGVQYPVLWFGPTDDDWGTCDWNVMGVPSLYLIDPEGTIVLDFYPNEDLSEILGYYIDQRGVQPTIGMTMTGVKNPDGTMDFELNVTNPAHTPLDVKLTFDRNVWEYWETIDGQMQRVDNPPPGAEPNVSNIVTLDEYSGMRQLTFDEFGCTVMHFSLPAPEPCFLLSYSAQIVLPGSEQLLGGRGITLTAGGYLAMETQEE